MTTAATVGVIAAGVALLEVALIPGMVIGGAAVLAPRLFLKSLPKSLPNYLPDLRRRLKPARFQPAGRVKSFPAGPARRRFRLSPDHA